MSTLKADLKHDEMHPLDYNDIKRIVSGKVEGLRMKLVDLEETRISDMKHFFGHNNNVCAVLLTATIGNRKQRHWSVLIRHAKNKLSFWESLGLGKKLKHYIDQPEFFDMLSTYHVEYSTVRFQRNNHDVRTCGLHLVARCLQYKKNNAQYARWLRSVNLDSDLVVSLLTHIGHKT